MADDASSIEIPGYTLIRAIGSGGSADVYLAVQQNLNRRVALKVVKPSLTSDARFGERFKREGRIIAQLNHPHIIPVYDIGEHHNHYYMAMEYLGGGDLREQAPQLSLGELLQTLSQVCLALQEAHQQGFVHRDIKPANILFREPGQAVLTDFGIARQSESLTQMTVTGAMLGTPAYMSPEQINGDPLDGRTDLYALGVTLFELLTGYLPYRGETMMAVAMQHTHADVPHLPEPSAFLQPLVDHLLAKQVEQRISDARQLRDEFEKILHDNDQLGASLTSLWPDKIPAEQPRVDPASYQRPAKKKPGKARLLVGATLLAVALGTGMFIINKPQPEQTGENQPIASDNITINEREANETSAPPLPTPPQTEPPPWLQTLTQANNHFEQGKLVAPAGDNALALYRQVLQQDAQNTSALAGERNILTSEALDVERLIQDQSLQQASAKLATLDALWPGEPRLDRLHEQVLAAQQRLRQQRLAAEQAQQQRKVDRHLQAAAAAMIAGRYLSSDGNAAVDHFRQVLAMQPQNQLAKDGLQQVTGALVTQVDKAISSTDFAAAETLLQQLEQVDPRHEQLQLAPQAIASAKAAQLHQQQLQQRRALLAENINQLVERNRQWLQGGNSLDGQLRVGKQLLSDISDLLDANADNGRLRELQQAARRNIAQIEAQQSAASQPSEPEPQQQPAARPMVGGF